MKTISIKDGVYNKLVDMKEEGESFSDTIERLIDRKFNVESYFGVLKDSNSLKEIEEYSRKVRKSAEFRL
ncbi:MAG: antitoxin VapB family protein [Archaeoglobaceae archaeon]